MRHHSNITSLVIIRGRFSYEAVVRFRDPKLDLIITARTRDAIQHMLSRKVGI